MGPEKEDGVSLPTRPRRREGGFSDLPKCGVGRGTGIEVWKTIIRHKDPFTYLETIPFAVVVRVPFSLLLGYLLSLQEDPPSRFSLTWSHNNRVCVGRTLLLVDSTGPPLPTRVRSSVL